MAIGINSTIDFFGTETMVTASAPGAVNSDAYSSSSDVNSWTNSDDAPWAMFTLELTAAGLSAAPEIGEVINLFCRHMTIESGVNTPTPDANYPVTYIGTFPVDNVDATQRHVIGPVRLPNYMSSQEYEFYIENKMTVANIGASGWDLWVVPMTFGPHA